MIKLGYENFKESITDKILVEFGAPWCGPCKSQESILNSLSTQNFLKIAKVDVDENPDLASCYNIKSVPTLILFENGEESKRFIGVQSLSTLQSLK